jgi:hypothetical protein
MNSTKWGGVLLTLVAGLALLGSGCGRGKENSGAKDGQAQKKPAAVEKDDHSGWWCAEHGLPEDICWACNSAHCKKLKNEGDWCKEHKRPQSQCFKCDPKLVEKFAAVYRAKEGKDPPKFEDY